MKTLLLILLTLPAAASLVVDPGPGDESMRSPRYRVVVSGGDAENVESFVYRSENNADFQKFPRGTFMAKANHWTSISADGPVTIEVSMPDSPSFKRVRIRPTSRGVKVEPTRSGARFTLENPGAYAVEIDAFDPLIPHPLLVFFNPPEEALPEGRGIWNFAEKGLPPADRTEPVLLHFPRGVHNLVRDHGVPLRPGSQLKSGDIVHLAPGAYVIGAFGSDRRSKNITLRGRGTLSGLGEPFVKSKYRPLRADAEIEFSYNRCAEHLVHLQGSGHRVEGLVFTDPTHFNVNIGDQSRVENIKCFGWHYSTDGLGLGEGTVVRDCFIKCNDDSFKLYANDIDIGRCVIWQQFNGGAFQFSWGHGGVSRGATVRDIDIIHDEHRRDANNRGLISCVELNSPMRGLTFENIRVEGDCYRLFDLRVQDGGSIEDLVLRNISVEGRILDANHLRARGGRFANVVIDNVSIGGKSATDPESLVLKMEGKVPAPVFQ
ncbi:MAG: hypothetical protein KDN05_07285 [Verrucomicrobiae bacterium]|nr:hypothetical protein [Verrucomicrobiae bacterium]